MSTEAFDGISEAVAQPGIGESIDWGEVGRNVVKYVGLPVAVVGAGVFAYDQFSGGSPDIVASVADIDDEAEIDPEEPLPPSPTETTLPEPTATVLATQPPNLEPLVIEIDRAWPQPPLPQPDFELQIPPIRIPTAENDDTTPSLVVVGPEAAEEEDSYVSSVLVDTVDPERWLDLEQSILEELPQVEHLTSNEAWDVLVNGRYGDIAPEELISRINSGEIDLNEIEDPEHIKEIALYLGYSMITGDLYGPETISDIDPSLIDELGRVKWTTYTSAQCIGPGTPEGLWFFVVAAETGEDFRVCAAYSTVQSNGRGLCSPNSEDFITTELSDNGLGAEYKLPEGLTYVTNDSNPRDFSIVGLCVTRSGFIDSPTRNLVSPATN